MSSSHICTLRSYPLCDLIKFVKIPEFSPNAKYVLYV